MMIGGRHLLLDDREKLPVSVSLFVRDLDLQYDCVLNFMAVTVAELLGDSEGDLFYQSRARLHPGM